MDAKPLQASGPGRRTPYDGPVVTGWGAIARTEEQAHQVVLDLIKSEPS